MSQTFTIYSTGGFPTRTVTCPADEIHLQIKPGEWYKPGDQLEAPPPPPPPAAAKKPAYAVDRGRAYPPVAEQLDMLWHAMNNGQMPIAEPFYSRIKAVKDAHPKT